MEDKDQQEFDWNIQLRLMIADAIDEHSFIDGSGFIEMSDFDQIIHCVRDGVEKYFKVTFTEIPKP